uniref:Flavin-containing monooxygenase n=1 Tax=Oryza punctata TaxID=4537 RepID=A0A0E0L925_ORYPU
MELSKTLLIKQENYGKWLSIREGLGVLATLQVKNLCNELMEASKTKRSVAIVGAGASGLAACKHLLARGFRPVVFESEEVAGGVWRRTLATTRLQTPAQAYRFSDFPWPAAGTEEEYPRHDEVAAYLDAYARRFGVLERVRFGSKVVSAEYVGVPEEEVAAWERWSGNGEAFGDGRGEWLLTVQHRESEATQTYKFDFVILCIGRYGIASVPTFPPKGGPEVFHGQVLHSMDYSRMDHAAAAELIRGKRVAVVGSGKSAFDTVAQCADANGSKYPCTMVYRSPQWMVDAGLVWGMNLLNITTSRLAELMVHKPGEGLLLSVLATMLTPLRWLLSKLTETYYKRHTPMQRHGMVPGYSFSRSILACRLGILPERFYDRVDDGSIVLRRCDPSFSFCAEGLVLDGATSDRVIDADVIILATGFQADRQLRDILASTWFGKIVAKSLDATVPLYRRCVHPRIPQMAIIGYAESAANIYPYEMMGKWVAHLLDGAFQLPDVARMEKSVVEWVGWAEDMRKCSGDYFRKSCIGTITTWYNDQLCHDMGYNPRRKKGLLADWIEPYGATDYAGIYRWSSRLATASAACGGACTLASTRLQTPPFVYRFSDFPWSPDVSGAEVVEYLPAYARLHGVMECVRFGCKMLAADELNSFWLEPTGILNHCRFTRLNEFSCPTCHSMRVAIVGAGASGLTSCKHALAKGFRPVVFEAGDGIGGVWRRTLASTRLQTPAFFYRFSDFPWPPDVSGDEVFPRHDQVVEYLAAYARRHGVMECVRFGCKVLAAEFAGVPDEEAAAWERWSGNGEAFGDGSGEWLLTVQNRGSETTQIHRFDFLILCIGRFSGVAHMPTFPPNRGPEVFQGQVLHSMDYSNMGHAAADELIRGKRVAVVGSGKSAFDTVAECAAANGARCPCAMICRSGRWMVNGGFVWGVSLGHLFCNRLAELMVRKPGEGLALALLAILLTPLHWIRFLADLWLEPGWIMVGCNLQMGDRVGGVHGLRGPDRDAGGPKEHLQVAGSLRHGDGARRGDPHGGVVLRHGFPPADDAVFAGQIKYDDDDDVPLPSRVSMEALASHTIAACRTAKRRPLPTQTYFKMQIPMEKHGMMPEESFAGSMSGCRLGVLPDKFYDRVEEGSILIKRAISFSFCTDGLVLDDTGERVEADVVVLATGFRGDQKLKDMFVSAMFKQMVAAPLYRQCIHPRIPQMAVIGYTENLTSIYTFEMMAKWVAHLLAGAFRLPSVVRMEASAAEWDEHLLMRRHGVGGGDKPCLGAVSTWYNDKLCRDMGYEPRRKKGILAEWLQPYGPADYAAALRVGWDLGFIWRGGASDRDGRTRTPTRVPDGGFARHVRNTLAGSWNGMERVNVLTECIKLSSTVICTFLSQ